MQIFPSGPIDGQLTVLVALLAPASRGRVRLASPDPGEAPEIDLRLLEDPADTHRLLAGVREARRIAASPPLASLLGGEPWPGPDPIRDDELIDAIRAHVGVYHHPVGTCRMGPAADPRSVVDPTGRLHGLTGLRVADASIMPVIPRANTNLPTLMLAERISELT